MNLGNAYRDRILGKRADNLEQAIGHYRASLAVMTQEAMRVDWARVMMNLASAYRGRSQEKRAGNFEQAILYYQQALTVQTLEQFPADHKQTQSYLGDLYFDEHNWAAAQTAYLKAIEAGRILLATAFTEPGRRIEVAGTSQLYTRVAYCFIQLGQPAEALYWLEQGKSRLLAEELALGDIDLAPLPDADRLTLQERRARVRELEAEMRLSTETPVRRNDRELAEALQLARVKLKETITAIRVRIPDFLATSLEVTNILKLIPPSGALVVPISTPQGGAVFVVPSGVETIGMEHIIRLAFTEADLNALVLGNESQPGWLQAYITYQNKLGEVFLSQASSTKTAEIATEQIRAATKTWHATIEFFTGYLWNKLMGPIHERLLALGLSEGAPVVLLPQGKLGLLPLHAA